MFKHKYKAKVVYTSDFKHAKLVELPDEGLFYN